MDAGCRIRAVEIRGLSLEQSVVKLQVYSRQGPCETPVLETEPASSDGIVPASTVVMMVSGFRFPNRWATSDRLSSDGSSVQSAGIGASSHRTEVDVVPR